MSDNKKIPNPNFEALGAEVCRTTFIDAQMAEIASSQGEPEISKLVRELDRFGDFSSERESLEKIDSLAASLESVGSPKPESPSETGAFGKEYRSGESIKLIPFEAGSITWRKFLKRTVPYIAAFAAGALTYAFRSDGDESITIASPEEALAQYNHVVEAAGGQLIVPMPPQRANTPEEVCWAAFGRLYDIVDNSPTTEDAEMFTRSLIDAGLCTDVHPERGYYGFIPHRETSQPTER